MRLNHRGTGFRGADSQRGQAFLVIVIFITFFLLAVLGLATDYSEVWAHRQNAQNAADAACQAGVGDVFLNAVHPSSSGTGGLGSFSWIGTDFDCTSSSTTPPCSYAALNGYPSNVHVSFPSSVPGVPSLTGAFITAYPYIKVTVTDPVSTYFSRIASPSQSVSVKASATCGLSPVSTPVPLVILHPTAAGALSITGSSVIKIISGPQRSIQVDSDNTGAVVVGTTSSFINIDLHLGGPSGNGSDFGVFGGPRTIPATIDVGSGHYISPANPFGDPFATVTAPSTSGMANGSVRAVPFAVNGCPDPNGCVEFTAGNYTGCSTGNLTPPAQGCLLLPYTGSNPKFSIAAPPWAATNNYSAGTLIKPTGTSNPGGFLFLATNSGKSGPGSPANWNQNVCNRQSDGTCSGGTTTEGSPAIIWQNVGVVVLNKLSTGIFDPGVYYVAANGFNLGDGSTARVSTATGDSSHGVMFYFSTSATVGVTSNSGKSAACTAASSGSGTPNGCVVSYSRDGTVSTLATGYVPSQALQCPSGSANPSTVPSILDGNILLGPCGPTTSSAYGSPDGNRGFLFFQNRSTSAAPSWGGGGQFLSSGFLYFHAGSGPTCGTNTTCLTLKGGSGSQSYTLGNIVTDELAMSGNPTINMFLNPTVTFFVLKARLLQ